MYLCTSASKCIHTRAHTSQSGGRDSPEDSRKITPLFAHHSIFPQPAGLPATSPTLPLQHALATDTVTLPPLCGTEMLQQPSFFFFFEKPFHFSLLRRSCSVMGCSHSASLRLKHTQPRHSEALCDLRQRIHLRLALMPR